LVNGAFARAFRSEVQPVEIAAALRRELDDNAAIVTRESAIVPNRFLVELSESDFERLNPYSQALTGELADLATEHAQTQSYRLIGPVIVELALARDLGTGVFRVASSSQPGAVAQPRSTAPPGPLPRPTLTGRLVINDTAFPLTNETTSLGRGSDVDIRIDDPGVSRHHANIVQSTIGYTVIDLASTNGTTVNGERVVERLLADGDEVRLGSTATMFRSG
jgi:hypothetical protein